MSTAEEFKFKYGSIKKFNEQDLSHLIFSLMDEDREYARDAGYGNDYVKMISDVISRSVVAFSIFDEDGEFVSSCGVSHTNRQGVGNVWILSGKGYSKNQNKFNVGAEFLRSASELLDFFHKIFPILTCRVVKSNKGANRRTRFLGFKVSVYDENFVEYIRHG